MTRTYDKKKIAALLGISKQTLWNWGRKGRFVLPDPVGLRQRDIQYDADVIDKMIDDI